MSSDMVCPECGSADFKQRRVALIEYTVRVREGRYEEDVSEEVVDGGDRDGPLVCDDCGTEYDDITVLVDADTYNDEED